MACKADKAQRALELASTLKSVRSIDGAIKIAVNQRMSTLAEKINGVKEVKR
jgi:chromosome transmission fidelity protein 4